MNVEYHHWWSPSLGQEMELKVYGHAGKAGIVFPTQGGRFFEFEDFGMVAACQEALEAGKVQLFTVDSIDFQAWSNWNSHPADRGRRHECYDRYIIEEVAPFIQGRPGVSGKLLVTGCSLGALHAANFFFRHPDVFDATIAISGPLSLQLLVGDYMDERVYFNSPLSYLPNLTDPALLDLYRQSRIVVCVGQGAWEEPMLADARTLESILAEKGVPAWIDYWGYDVNHDWPWWRRMLPYHLEKLSEEASP